MQREKYSEELKANILIDRKKRDFGSREIARKMGIHESAAVRVVRMQKSALKNGGDGFSSSRFSPEFEKVSPPDENLQDASQKIDFYKNEAEKYKNLAKNLEKSLGLLKDDRDGFSARQMELLLEKHEVSEIAGKWTMSHDDFMEFFSDFGAT